MQARLLPVLLSLGAFCSTMAGGLLVFRLRDRMGPITAFAAGVLIAVPLFDLLPESLKLAEGLLIPVEHVMYAAGAGFLFLYALERYFSVHRVCEGGTCRNVRHPKGGLLGAAELSAHSFLDGFAIGLGYHYDARLGAIVAAAVITHDFSDGINTVTVMLHSGNSLRSSLAMLFADALAPVVGAGSTLFFTASDRYLTVLLPFFAGGFLYLGAGDLLPESHEKNPPLVALLCCIGGFALIGVLTNILGV